MQTVNEADEVAQSAAVVFEQQGIGGLLAFLNARTRYRFTGLYRVEPPLLRNVCLFDRENPELQCSGDVSMLNDTYCCIVVDTASEFVTENGELEAGGVRNGVVSYCGVPIVSNERTIGTLCHFDLRPRLTYPDEVAVMHAVASMLTAHVSADGP